MYLEEIKYATSYNNNKSDTEGNLMVARIIEEHKGQYKILTELGEKRAVLKGTYIHKAVNPSDFPAVGDFVMVDFNKAGDAIIYELLQRKSKFSRSRSKGREDERDSIEQVVAANFDYVFIMASLNQDFNLRRLERYLTAAWQSGAIPVLVLTKADLCSDFSILSEINSVAVGVEVYTISSFTGEGLDNIKKYFIEGKTIVFLGSSGVGKSTLVNCLLGEEKMKVNTIRKDDSKGRHTTTHRQLISLPTGAMIIDTPGMRELALWDSEEGISNSFSDIKKLATMCKFSDCTHSREPQCAVKKAIEDGTLDIGRYESYVKLQREARYFESKSNRQLQEAIEKRMKDISKFSKAKKKFRRK